MTMNTGAPAVPPATPLLEMRAISKSFGDVEVLRGVNFDLRSGEVHILAGENGAGKSTLVKILAGVYDDYRGEILLRGVPCRFARPNHAYDAGIAVIYQELSLVDSLSIGQNLLLGREEGGVLGWLDRRREKRRAERLLAEAAIHADPAAPADAYPIGTRQAVEIAKALSRDASILVMDEPTSALTDPDVERLFRLVRSLTREGKGIIYITHKLEEIFRIGDRVTVLRDGETVVTTPVAALNRGALVRQMVGREVPDLVGRSSGGARDELLEVKDLSVRAPGEGRFLVEGVSLTVRKGEIVGLAGLQGCGNSEVLEAVFSAQRGKVSGSIVMSGAAAAGRAPAEAIRRRMALLTNDRSRSGLVLERPVRENITLASLGKFSPAGWVLGRREDRAALKRRDQLRIRASLQQEVGTLSGGNQQKVVFAKWLETAPLLLLLDDPTRGVDVGAKAEIHALVTALRDEGCGILLVSSETPELLSLSDRVLVMRAGRIVADFDRAAASQEAVLAAALGSGSVAHE